MGISHDDDAPICITGLSASVRPIAWKRGRMVISTDIQAVPTSHPTQRSYATDCSYGAGASRQELNLTSHARSLRLFPALLFGPIPRVEYW